MTAGDYVRTKRGTFDRFITSHTQDNLTWYTFEDRGNITNPENYIIKSSPNIIDLIEVGDFINKQCIVEIKDNTFYTSGGYFLAFEDFDDIVETIVTHEQFSSMEYKVESEVK